VLAGHKRRRCICHDARSQRFSGVAVKAGGQVHRQHTAATGPHGIDSLNRLAEWPSRWTGQPRAEEGVDDPGGVGKFVFPCRLIRLCHAADIQPRLLSDRQVDGRIASQVCRRAGKQDPHPVAGIVEVTGDHEAVATVVALAAGDDDRAGDAHRLQQPRRSRTGVFHQHDAGHAVVFDGCSVDFSDFSPCQGTHRGGCLLGGHGRPSGWAGKPCPGRRVLGSFPRATR